MGVSYRAAAWQRGAEPAAAPREGRMEKSMRGLVEHSGLVVPNNTRVVRAVALNMDGRGC